MPYNDAISIALAGQEPSRRGLIDARCEIRAQITLLASQYEAGGRVDLVRLNEDSVDDGDSRAAAAAFFALTRRGGLPSSPAGFDLPPTSRGFSRLDPGLDPCKGALAPDSCAV